MDEEAPAREDLFVSYSRRDEALVRRLVEMLDQRGRRCWVDWEGIPPSAEWMREVTAAIDRSQAFVFALSPDSAASTVCRQELDRAAAVNKRIIPIVVRDTDPGEIPEVIARHNWLFFRKDDDPDRALELLDKTLNTDPAWAATHTRLLVRAVEWEDSGHNPSYFLRGQDLKAAEQWLTEAGPEKDPQPTPLHTEYVIASRSAATRSQRIRTAVLGVGLVVAVALAALALVQRGRAQDQADVARSRELASRSLLDSSTDPPQALSEAVAAGEIRETAEAEQALRLGLEGTSSLELVLHGESAFEDVEFSGDGSLLAAAGDDGNVHIWTASDGREGAVLQSSAPRVLDLAFAHATGMIALAAGGRIELWDPIAGRRLRTVGVPSDRIRGVALSPDGKLVAGASSAGSAVVWRTADGREMSRYSAPRGQVFSVDFDPSGTLVASAGDDGKARVFKAATGRGIATFDVAAAAKLRDEDVNDAQFAGGNSLVVTASHDGSARIWGVRSERLINTIDASTDELRRAQLSRSGLRLLTAGFDGVARVWATPADGTQLRPSGIGGPALTTLAGHSSGILGAALSPNGKRVATASADGTVGVWASEADDSIRHYDEHRYGVRQVQFSPEGTDVVSAAADGTARIWDATTARTVRVLPVRTPYVVDANWSADAKRIAVAGWNSQASVWDTGSGHVVRGFIVPHAKHDHDPFDYSLTDPPAARLTPDGSSLVAPVADGRIIVWDVHSGEVERVIHTSHQPVSLDLSPDGTEIAVAGSDHEIPIIELATGKTIRTLSGHDDSVATVEFSPDGQELVSASLDGTARIWDLGDGATLAVLSGHTDEVHDAAFSPDASRVVTGGSDRTVRVWDTATGRQLEVLNGSRDWVQSVDFSADGTLIASGGLDRSGRVYRCDLCVPFADLMALAGDRLDRIGTE